MNYRRAVFLLICIVFSAVLFRIYNPIDVYYDRTTVNHNILNDGRWEMIYDEWQKIAAHPWLSSNPSSTALFSNLCNDLDRLLMFMSNKTNKVVLLRFSYPWQIMLQNQIYTLVRFGKVYNYIVMVGDKQSLKACLELNLPCFNGTSYYMNYYKETDPTVDALYSDKKHYQPMVWFKLRFYRDVLIRNYTILACDTDIAFSRKNIWLSLKRYSEDVGNCDMIFMREYPVNTGFFYSRSNPGTVALLDKWITTERKYRNLNDQQSFGTLRGYYYEICNTKDECNTIKQRKMIAVENNLTDASGLATVTVRTFNASYVAYGTGVCPTDKKVNPCLITTVFVHAVCTVGQSRKIQKIKMNGFWLLEEKCSKSSIYFSIENNRMNTLDIHRCEPLVFKDPKAEQEFEKCNNEVAWLK